MRPRAVRAGIAVVLGLVGCAQPTPRPESLGSWDGLQQASAAMPGPANAVAPLADPLEPPPIPPDLSGPQPVDVLIRHALAENRNVQAALHDVLAMRHRVPQVTALEDPMVQNVIWPIPSHAPQYSLMGYMPYDLMITQQFPWFGTLRLRGQVAEQDVRMALARLAAAQLEVVAEVKRAYYDLYFNQRAEAILAASRKAAAEIADLARVRNQTGGSIQDVLRSDVAIAELDRELVTVRQELVQARADLAQQLHISPEAPLQTVADIPMAEVPEEIERLYRLAAASRPELQERLAAIARDQREVKLARKRYYPDVSIGLAYNLMTRQNAASPTANGADNVGLAVSFNLPVYRKKLAAAVCEAQARTIADAQRYEAERDRTYREVKDLLVQSKAQRDIIALLEDTIRPKSRQALEAAAAGYLPGTVDFVSVNTARLELLQVELQLARVEAELGKAVASLERVVGNQVNEHPPAPAPAANPNSSSPRLDSPPASQPGPFSARTDEKTSEPLMRQTR